MVGKRASKESTSRSSIESGSSWRAIHPSTPIERTAASSPGRGPDARRLSTRRPRPSGPGAPTRRGAGATAGSGGVEAAWGGANAAPAPARPRRVGHAGAPAAAPPRRGGRPRGERGGVGRDGVRGGFAGALGPRVLLVLRPGGRETVENPPGRAISG